MDLITDSQPLFLLPAWGQRGLCLASFIGRVGKGQMGRLLWWGFNACPTGTSH